MLMGEFFLYKRGVTGWRRVWAMSKEQKKERVLFVKFSSFVPICELGFVGLCKWD